MYLLCTPRQPAYCVFTAFSGFLVAVLLPAYFVFTHAIRVFSEGKPFFYQTHSPDFLQIFRGKKVACHCEP